jgi:chromosome segregation protein
MILTNLKISGFRGIQNSITVPIGAGFTVITGRNGTGKTSLCDAIEFAITGVISRFSEKETEKGENIADYLWWRGATTASRRQVELELKGDDGKPVSRIITPARKAGFDPSILYEHVTAPPDPVKVLCQTSIFRDELIADFSTDLSETERFEFVNRAIGLSELLTLESRGSEYQKAITKQLDTVERQYEDARAEVARITAEIAQQTTAVGTLSTNVEEALQAASIATGQQLSDATVAVRLLNESTTRLRRDLDRIVRMQSEFKNLSELETRREQLERQSQALSSELEQLHRRLQEVEHHSQEAMRAATAEQEKAPFSAALAQLREYGGRIGLRDGRCPLCGVEVTADQFRKHLAEITTEIQQQNRRMQEVTATQAETSEALRRIRSEHQTASVTVGQIRAEIDSIVAVTDRTRTELAALGIGFSVEEIEAAMQKRASELERLERHITALGSLVAMEVVARLRRQLDAAQKNAADLAKRSERLSAANQNAASFTNTAKRVSREILEERLAALNPLLSELYFRLRPHVDYDDVTYRMRGDVRRFLRLEVGDDINPRFIFSSGQRRALGLAFLLSVYLSRPWCRLQTLVLDEPIQHIDDYRALHLVELLSSIRQLGRQMVCTVEDPELADLLCRRLRATDAEMGIRVELVYRAGHGVEVSKVEHIAPLPQNVLLTA